MSQAIERERRQGGLLQQLETLGVPTHGFNQTAFSLPAERQASLLVSPQHHSTPDAQASRFAFDPSHCPDRVQ